MKKVAVPLTQLYKKLYKDFGPQHWWPGQSAFEVMVGAILTQNTNWQNVEKAITNLKKRKVLSFKKMFSLPENKLAALIRPAGYYNIKARRLKNFLRYLAENYSGNLAKMRQRATPGLRQELLSVNGIGPETADSILLYGLNRPVFVIDAYTKRILQRHKFITGKADYHQAQGLFTRALKKDVKLFNEYHALLVKLAKDFCLKNKPRCQICPINS